jgi:hypothetical protein
MNYGIESRENLIPHWEILMQETGKYLKAYKPDLQDAFHKLLEYSGSITMDWLQNQEEFAGYRNFRPYEYITEGNHPNTDILFEKYPDNELGPNPASHLHLNLTSISGGGQTSTARLLGKMGFEICYTFTTKQPSQRPDEAAGAYLEVFPGEPSITYPRAWQYAHVTDAQFDYLNAKNYFIAVKIPEGIGWENKYGTAKPILEFIINNRQTVHSISVLDVDGSKQVHNWLSANFPSLAALNCFIIPARSWRDSTINMMQTRKESELIPRFAEAVEKITSAPQTSELIGFNISDKSGSPVLIADAINQYACSKYPCK